MSMKGTRTTDDVSRFIANRHLNSGIIALVSD